MVEHVVAFVTDLVWRIGPWGYVIVFAGAALESSAFLGFLVPGETLVILAGALAAAGLFDVSTLGGVVAAGAIIGDSIGYELGRHLGGRWLATRGGWAERYRDRVATVQELFRGHGGKAVLFGRFIGFLRALTPFVAGASRMPYARFLAFNAAGAVLWTAGCLALGYFLGESWRVAERWVGRAGLVVGVVVVAAVAWTWRRQRRRRRAERAGR